MITEYRKVYHANQAVTEYWQHHSTYGWQYVEKEIGEDWHAGDYSYYLLRHHGQEWKNLGHYGPMVVW